MNDLGWGLTMTAAGMGAVFALLALLMAVLYGIGRLDRAAPPAPPGHRDDDLLPEPGTGPTVAISGADGLDADALAAIAIAVTTHAEVRRQQSAPREPLGRCRTCPPEPSLDSELTCAGTPSPSTTAPT